MRIDVRKEENGRDVIWRSGEHSTPVVPKFSGANGPAYFYTFEPQPDANNAWYLGTSRGLVAIWDQP